MEQQRKNFELQRGTFKGFFEDFRSNLESGQNVWKSFADAVGNALQKILDRLFDLWLDQAFQMLIGGGSRGNGGGGFFSSIFNAIGLAAGEVSGNVNNSGGAVKIGFKNAKGNAFGSSIINEPTMFGYGSNQVGQLGEAGPEAIMPLRRGADGSLGVQMHGAAAAQAARSRVDLYVHPEEGDMFKARVEALADNRAVNIVQAGIEQYNDALPTRIEEITSDPRVR